MKTAIKFAPFLLAALASVAMPAMADDDRRGGGHDRGNSGHRDRDDRGRGGLDDNRGDRGRWSRDDDRGRHDRDRNDRRYDYSHNQYRRPVVIHRPVVTYRNYPAYRSHASYRGYPSWARGRDYRSYGYNNVYYVPYNDYGRYRLHRPGYDQRWVRDDRGNFLLVAAATGIITSILLNHGY